ncbi:MAG: transketolase C-terminal domain-containing protein [Verrucomicrobiota bacterium]|jgi:transketolase|nr:transketolase C-terminal domain-containing protein [Verrucomicrobiota bacterium]
MRDAFVAALTELAEDDPSVFLITADLGFGVLTQFAERFPKQFLNVGVAEQNMTGVATGLALEGRVVFTYSIANFPTLRCLEQIRNDALYHNVNVNVVAIGGGFSYGALGMSHHATEDLAIMRALPGLVVVSPGCLWETRGATRALALTDGPSYLRLDKSNAGDTKREGEVFNLGAIRTLREGDALTIAATGGILAEALSAAETLGGEGIACRVLSVNSLRPLDKDTVERACAETGGLLAVEEHLVEGGLGGLLAECCLENDVRPKTFYRLGLRDGWPKVVGSQQYLRGECGVDAAAIAVKARQMVLKSK